MARKSFPSLMAVLLALAQSAHADNIDYQKAADAATWDWRPDDADIITLIQDPRNRDYHITLDFAPTSREITFIIGQNGKQIYQWTGHRHSSFAIRNHVLFYCDYNPLGHGGSIVAVDLNAGKELWRSQLLGSAAALHIPGARGGGTTAPNRMILYVNGDSAITVFGKDGWGRYIEYKDQKTGETIGHKALPLEIPPPAEK